MKHEQMIILSQDDYDYDNNDDDNNLFSSIPPRHYRL